LTNAIGREMGIRFQCPNGHRLHVKTFLAGKRGICPQCGAKFTIPAVAAADEAQGVAAEESASSIILPAVAPPGSPEERPSIIAPATAGAAVGPAARIPASIAPASADTGPPAAEGVPIIQEPVATETPADYYSQRRRQNRRRQVTIAVALLVTVVVLAIVLAWVLSR
jgi:hypothetical protein